MGLRNSELRAILALLKFAWQQIVSRADTQPCSQGALAPCSHPSSSLAFRLAVINIEPHDDSE